MLTGMLTSLGFQHVTVTFGASGPNAAPSASASASASPSASASS
jgi:hypothetical protein